jgi:DNA-binding Xre family transcriptional regulator
MKYDADKLAADVNTKRQIKNRLTTREAAAEIGVGHCTVHRAEVRKGLSNKSFLKICQWLEKEPGAYKIETA